MSQQPEGSVEKKEVPEAGKGGATTKLQTSQRPSTTRGVQLATNRRTAMGEYIVPEEGRPLTQQASPSPGPSDYHPTPDLCFSSAPRYSIIGRNKQDAENKNPGPDQYDTSQGAEWTDKTRTLKAKGKTRPYDIRADAHITCSIGAGGYLVNYGDTGHHAVKHSIASRHLQGLNVGPPNNKVQPVDTHGFNTPGPGYRPNSPYWGRGSQKSFGLKLLYDEPTTPGLGPAGYDPKKEGRGVSYSFGFRLDPDIGIETPGPNAYDISSTIGTAPAKSMSGRQKFINKSFAPSPDTYDIRDFKVHGPQYSMTYREFDRDVEENPSPAQYSPSKVTKKRSPSYSCRQSCRPCFPDILNYPKLSPMQNPGPGTHSINRDFSKNDGPAYSQGKWLQQPTNNVPGPNHYRIRMQCRPDSRRAPEYSMAKRLERPQSSYSEGPGPSKYFPRPKSGTPSYSMTSRQATENVTAAPAANAYSIATGQTHRGKFCGHAATLKARASPFVYSGFDNISRLSSMA